MHGLLTIVHVVLGSVALAAAPAALIVRAGGRAHRWLGTAFTLAMGAVLGSAAFLWQAKGHVFLVPLGVVSGYLVFNGWRVVERRRRGADGRLDRAIDLTADAIAIAAGAVCAAMGFTPANPLVHQIAPALIGVGSIAAAFGINDALGFTARRRLPIGWLLAHLSAMLATYVSAVTAFVVINAHGVPMLLRWALPAATGALLIAAYSLRVLRAAATRASRSHNYTIAAAGRASMSMLPARLRRRSP